MSSTDSSVISKILGFDTPPKSPRERVHLKLRDYLFQTCDSWDVRAIKIADTTAIIVDDVLRNADDLAEFATSLDYEFFSETRRYKAYPGRRASVCWATDSLTNRILLEYSRHTGAPLVGPCKRHPAFFTRIDQNKMRDVHCRQVAPHMDIGQKLVAIIHLTSQVGDPGATAFYRHRRTGIQSFPSVPSLDIATQMRIDGFNPLSSESYSEYLKHIIYDGLIEYADPQTCTGISKNNEIWEILEIIQGKFNRLVVFPGEIFHSPIYRNNKDYPDAFRLTMNMAFELI